MQITTTLTNAAPRQIVPRNGSQPFLVFEIFDHENTAWRVREDVYNVARNWIGQTINAVVRVEQNGQWTNRFADIVELGSGPPLAIPQQAVPQAPVHAAMQAAAAQQAAGRTVPQGAAVLPHEPLPPSQKDREIHRQVAAKVAALISGEDPIAFWTNCVDLAHYFDTGQTPTASLAGGGGSGYDEDVPF